MSAADGDVLHEVSFVGDAIAAVAMVTDGAVWVTQQGAVYIWDRGATSGDPEMIDVLTFRPQLMTATSDGLLYFLSTDHVGCYRLEKVFSVAAHDDPVLDCGMEDLSNASYQLTEVFLQSSATIYGATNLSTAPDGSVAAISTPRELVLVPGDATLDISEHFSDPHAVCSRDPFLHLNCADWFDEKGCVLTCFASPQRIFVVSASNHLVCVELDWVGRTAYMIRDGHVVTRAHNILCMKAGQVQDSMLAIGLSDGTVKLLQSETLEVFHSCDVVKYLERYVLNPAAPAVSQTWQVGKSAHAVDRRRQRPTSLPADAAPVALSDATGVCFFYPLILDVAVGPSLISVALPDAVVYINKHALEVEENMLFFRDEAVGRGKPPTPMTEDAWESSLSVMQSAPDGSWVAWFPSTNTLQYLVKALDLSAVTSPRDHLNGPNIIHAARPLPPHWLAPFLLLSERAAAAEPKGRAKKCTGAPLTNKPVTFGHPIRSTGYGAVPWSVQQDRMRDAVARSKKATAQHSDAKVVRYVGKEPYAAHPLTALSSANRILAAHTAVHRAAVLSTVFTANGEALVTTSGDSTGFFLKLPVNRHKGDGTILKGHKAPVHCAAANLSLKCPAIATGSADGTIMLWKPQLREAPFITHGTLEGKEIRGLSFFYLDKFLLYASGNTLGMVHYAFDHGGGELHRARNESALSAPLLQYKVDAQSITAMGAINHFTSPLVVLASSSKSLCVYDVCEERPLRITVDAHARAVHHISMCSSSRYANCSLGTLHSFVTAAMDGAVRLWDLRQDRPVRQFALHRNQSLSTLGLGMSPMGSMIAVGSEDRSIVLYDVRMPGTPLDVIRCEDVPTSLAWHPVNPVLTAGLSSGAIFLYAQR